MKKAFPVVIALGVLSLVATTSAGASALAIPSSLPGFTPAQVANLALANARAKGSCSTESQGKSTGYSFSESTNSTPAVAQQFITFNSSSSGVERMVGGVVYAKLSASMISLQFGVADPTYANKWVAIPRTNHHFVTFSSGLLFSSMLSQVRPVGPLTQSPVGTLNGKQVIAIGGTANAQLGLSASAETLFVSAASPYLPVELTASGRADGVPTTLVVTFSNWGRHFSYTAPTGAIPIASTTLP
ncbi:MAG TPA: hypothetical protein VIJ86_09315 [Acidimicrobiales bacterium]